MAAVNHTDGRHGQWNYVAHLPYYDDEKATGVLVPRRLAEAGEHAFRFTFVGPKCHATSGAVHGVALRITAPFTAVKDRLPAFKTALASTLAEAAGVVAERIRIDHVREGSVIAEVHVLPAAVHTSGLPHGSVRHDAATAVEKIEIALQQTETPLDATLCALVQSGAKTTGCTVQVLAKGRLLPLMDRSPPVAEKKPTETEPVVYISPTGATTVPLPIALGGVAACILVAVVAGVVSYKQRKAQLKAAEKDAKPEDTTKMTTGVVVLQEDATIITNPTVVVAATRKSVDEKEQPAAIDDSASTVSPKDDLETRSEASVPSELAEERMV